MKRTLCIILSLSAAILLFCGCTDTKVESFSDECLTVYFFDVGQADSSLLRFPDGTVMLIDSGNRADGSKISDYMLKLGITTVDWFVCTHPHEDHIGGASDIFESFEISALCLPAIDDGFTPDTAIYKNLLSSAEKEQCRVLSLTENTVIAETDSYSILSLSPRYGSIYSDLNDWSLCLKVDCFTNTILFMGDAEFPSELDILDSAINLDTDILKVGHHGSSGSSSDAFLNRATPMVSIISCGADNTYGHPSAEALSRLGSVGSKVFRTDTVGTVIAKCYNGGFGIETDNNICLDGNR